jgi:hypothetical protein
MKASVIQGRFIGGCILPATVERRTDLVRPGPPVRAGSPQPVAQPRAGSPHLASGRDGRPFAIDPGRVGLGAGRGKPLPDDLRARMEAAIGADFSRVRVHVGPQAARIGALAFTTGPDIYFAPGRYQPDTPHGQQLIGHELAHVVQQRQGRVRNPAGAGIVVVQDPALEAEADRLGRRAAAGPAPLPPTRPGPVFPRRAAVQRMVDPRAEVEAICEAILAFREQNGLPLDGVLKWDDLKKIPLGMIDVAAALRDAGVKNLKNFWSTFEGSQAYRARRAAIEASERANRERADDHERRRLADVGFRRMETLARFLETDQNVCVAIAQVGGKIIATTNRQPIAPLEYRRGGKDEAARLKVTDGHRALEEQTLAVSAKKLSDFVGASSDLIDRVNSIIQVGAGWDDNMHAEMKLLDYLCDAGVGGSVTFYISRVCCPKCRKALDAWNASGKPLRIVVRTGTHGSRYPGWTPPRCIKDDPDLPLRIAGPIPRRPGRAAWRDFSNDADLNILSNRRDRSPSPPPKGGRFETL